MSQRYFLTTESAYEALRLALDADLGYPTSAATSIFTPALEAPRDSLRRIVLAVDDALPHYAEIIAKVEPLLSSASAQELTEAEYLAFLVCVSEGGGNATFSTVTDTLTYTNFLTEAGSLADALSGIDTALSGKASASDAFPSSETVASEDYSQTISRTQSGASITLSETTTIGGLGSATLAVGYGSYAASLTLSGNGDYSGAAPTTTLTVTNNNVTFPNAVVFDGTYDSLGGKPTLGTAAAQDSSAFAAASHAHGELTSDGKVGTTAGLVLKTGTDGVIEALAMGTAGQVLKINSGATGVEWVTLGGAASLNVGTTAGTVAAGDHTHAQLHDRSHAITSTSDHTAGNWKVLYTNGSGQVVELGLGDSGKALISNGASAAPSWGQAGSNSASDLTTGTLSDSLLSTNAQAAINLYLWSAFR